MVWKRRAKTEDIEWEEFIFEPGKVKRLSDGY